MSMHFCGRTGSNRGGYSFYESNPKNGNGSGRKKTQKAQKPKINGDPTALVTFTRME